MHVTFVVDFAEYLRAYRPHSYCQIRHYLRVILIFEEKKITKIKLRVAQLKMCVKGAQHKSIRGCFSPVGAIVTLNKSNYI